MIELRYAVIRVVPRAERDESLNVGVVVYCPSLKEIQVRIVDDLDVVRLVDPSTDLDAVTASLQSFRWIAEGDSRGGPAASEDARVRFGHLTAPRSTLVRTSPSHGGQAPDLTTAADDLYQRLVAR